MTCEQQNNCVSSKECGLQKQFPENCSINLDKQDKIFDEPIDVTGLIPQSFKTIPEMKGRYTNIDKAFTLLSTRGNSQSENMKAMLSITDDIGNNPNNIEMIYGVMNTCRSMFRRAGSGLKITLKGLHARLVKSLQTL